MYLVGVQVLPVIPFLNTLVGRSGSCQWVDVYLRAAVMVERAGVGIGPASRVRAQVTVPLDQSLKQVDEWASNIKRSAELTGKCWECDRHSPEIALLPCAKPSVHSELTPPGPVHRDRDQNKPRYTSLREPRI